MTSDGKQNHSVEQKAASGQEPAGAQEPAAEEKPAVRLHEVSKRYSMVFRSGSRLGAFLYGNLQSHVYEKKFWALDKLSFEVARGRTVALIGPNGAGKSTLLQALAGITAIDEGKIELNGQVGAMLELGCGFHPDLNGYENCFLHGAILGLPRSLIAERLPAIIEFAELGEAMEQPVRFYSTGMFARLAFSLSIHIDPDILLLDEIITVGDREFQGQSLRKILELREAGKTIIIVTHALSLASEICDEAVWLDEGRLVEMGPARPVIRNFTRWVNRRILDRGEQTSSRFNFVEEERRRTSTRRRKLVDATSGRFAGEIDSVKVLDADGRVAAKVAPRDKLVIRAEYHISRPIAGMRLKCLIIRDDGYIINELITDELDEANGFALKGEIVMEVERLPLIMGSFEVVVGFCHQGDSEKDIRLCEASTAFKITDALQLPAETACFIPGKCTRIE